eukprot:gene1204-1389_t
MTRASKDTCFAAACNAGNLDIVKMIYVGPTTERWIHPALSQAINGNHIPIVQYLYSCGYRLQNGQEIEATLTRCGANGHIDMLRYILQEPAVLKFPPSNGGPWDYILPILKLAMSGACDAANLDSARSIESEFTKRLPKGKIRDLYGLCEERSVGAIMDSGATELMDMVVCARASSYNVQPYTYLAWSKVSMIQWMMKHCPSNVDIKQFIICGHLSIVQWLHNEHGVDVKGHMVAALESSHCTVDIVRYLHQVINEPLNTPNHVHPIHRYRFDIIEYMLTNDSLCLANVEPLKSSEINETRDPKRVGLLYRIGYPINQAFLNHVLFNGTVADLDQLKSSVSDFSAVVGQYSLYSAVGNARLDIIKWLVCNTPNATIVQWLTTPMILEDYQPKIDILVDQENQLDINVYRAAIKQERSIYLQALYDYDQAQFQENTEIDYAFDYGSPSVLQFLVKLYPPTADQLDGYLKALIHRGCVPGHLSNFYMIDLSQTHPHMVNYKALAEAASFEGRDYYPLQYFTFRGNCNEYSVTIFKDIMVF